MSGGRLLAAVGVLALVAFAVQRSRSPFLRIEAEPGIAARVAAEVGLAPVDVMALRELLGAGLDEAQLTARARRFVADRDGFAGSEALAAVAAVGHRAVAERLFAAAGRSASAAEADLRPMPEAIAAVRFRATRERFASRRAE